MHRFIIKYAVSGLFYTIMPLFAEIESHFMGLFFVLIGIYAALSGYVLYFWQKKSAEPYPLAIEHIILGIALLIQFVWGIQHIFQNGFVVLGMSSVLTLVVWVMLLWYWVASYFYRLQGLQLLLFPATVITMVMVLLFPGKPIAYPLTDLPFLIHILVSVLAYSLFGLAAMFALLLWQLSYALRQKKNTRFIQFLPPLLSLEKYMFQILWVGFILLTLSMISGTVFAEIVFGEALRLTHKLVFGVISWLIYAALLLGRLKYRWRGKTAARFVLTGFFFLVLTYTGTRFVLEIILKR